MPNRNNCVCCNKTVIKSPWNNCLDQCSSKDIPEVKLCQKNVNVPSNSTLQPQPSQKSNKFRQAQIVKQPGNTAYGRWSRAKWIKKDKQYVILNGAKTRC